MHEYNYITAAKFSQNTRKTEDSVFINWKEKKIDIGTLLRGHARYRPDSPAIEIGDSEYTFKELNWRANRLSNALLDNGISKGDKVATMMTNRLELVLMYWAAAKTGIVIVPMSTMLQAAGLEPLLNDSDSLMIIADVSFAQLLNNIRQDVAAIKNNRYISVGEDVAPAGFLNFDNFIETATKNEPPDPNLTDNDV